MLARIIGAALLGIALAGCNTFSGMGQDIERGGEKLQGEARETQQEMRQR